MTHSDFSSNWSETELEASVREYLRMQDLEAKSHQYSKREIYRGLSLLYPRSEKAFEYRMQNISAVLDAEGLPWLAGLKPAGNVGTNVHSKILSYYNRLRRNDGWKRKAPKPSPSYREKLPYIRRWLLEVAKRTGIVEYGTVMQVFDIDRFSLRHAMSFLGHQALNNDEPILTAVIINKTTRRCSRGFALEFGIEDDNSERERLYRYWAAVDLNAQEGHPPSVNMQSSRVSQFVCVEARPDQAMFRRRVFAACGGRCVLSGCEVVSALDAAHKVGRDWRKGHNQAADGYLLRKDLHALYDAQLIRIDENGRVHIDEQLRKHYGELADRTVTVSSQS